MAPLPTLALLVSGLAAGCTRTAVAPLPQPLPETLAWAAAGPHSGDEAGDEAGDGGGAFLGLKTRENVAGGFDELDFQPGLYVTQVVEGSPAAAAGCQAGDVLLSLDGRPTDDPESLSTLLAAHEPGGRVELEVRRGDTVFAVPVVLDDDGASSGSPEARATQRLDPVRSRAGWATGRGGAVLVASHEEAPFPRAGIAVGSIVRRVDGEEVLSARALIRRLESREPGERIEVDYVSPEGEERRARVRLQAQPTRVTRASVPILFDYEADAQGESVSFSFVDLWVFSLFRYERTDAERHWRLLHVFRFSSGVGELAE